MSWDERTRVRAFERRPRPPREAQHDHDDCLKCSIDDQIREGFEEGARWQREALLAGDVIERAAHGIHASHDRGEDFDNEPQAVQDEYRDMARVALAAALGIEGDE